MKIGVYSFQEGKEPKDLEKQIKILEKQLKIAVKYLKIICDDYSCSTCMSCLGSAFAKTALGKIEELDK